MKFWLTRYKKGNYYVRVVYDDGSVKKFTTGTKNKREAERFRLHMEETHCVADVPPIKHLAEEYAERLGSKGYRASFRSSRRYITVTHADELTQIEVDRIVDAVIAESKSLSTAASYLKNLRAFFNWLTDRGYMSKVKVKVPHISDDIAARGEPLTIEQYQNILDAVPLVYETIQGRSMKQFIQGLWLSGFRLDELHRLTWDDRKETHIVDLDDNPMVVFPAAKQKSRRAERWPIPKDLAKFLRKLPERSGKVFSVLGVDGKPIKLSSSIGVMIKKVTAKAGVMVESSYGLRYASANDLRRSFAQRWYEITGDMTAAQRIARHKTDFVTKRFYAREKAERLQKRLDAALKRWEGEE